MLGNAVIVGRTTNVSKLVVVGAPPELDPTRIECVRRCGLLPTSAVPLDSPPMALDCAGLLLAPIAAICRCDRLRSRERAVLNVLLRVVSDFRCGCWADDDNDDDFAAVPLMVASPLLLLLVPAAVVVAEPDTVAADAAGSVDSLHEERLDSLPCDAVSETKLCVSSKPSSFRSCCCAFVVFVASAVR